MSQPGNAGEMSIRKVSYISLRIVNAQFQEYIGVKGLNKMEATVVAVKVFSRFDKSLLRIQSLVNIIEGSV